MYNNQFSAHDNVKWLAKRISTKVSFKILLGKGMFKTWPWIWNQYFYFVFWNDDRTKLIVLPSFQLAARLNSQNTYETVFHNEIWKINLYMNIGISNWHNWSYYPTSFKFLTLYQFFTQLLTSKHLKPIRP